MASPLRVAVAGTGFIGAVHVRSARLAGAHVVGVSASSAARAEQAAAALGVERAFATSEELVRADDVDVVHVCTPNHLHLPLAEAALAAGKHVICEKPLALDVAGARRLVDAATAAGRVAAVPFAYRYYPTLREARERVRGGATGPLHLLHGTYLQDWLLRPEDNNWRVDAELGGPSRTFADIGSHWCDLAEFVSGHRITKLSARMLTALPQRLYAESRPAFSAAPIDGEVRDVGTEDAAVVQFETDRGAIGTTIVSQISAGRKNRLWLEFDGAEGPSPSTRRTRRRCGSAAARPPRCCAATPSPVAAGGAPREGPSRPPARLRGLLRPVRRRRLRPDPRRGARRRADVRRRPARRADHRGRARVRQGAALGRRRSR